MDEILAFFDNKSFHIFMIVSFIAFATALGFFVYDRKTLKGIASIITGVILTATIGLFRFEYISSEISIFIYVFCMVAYFIVGLIDKKRRKKFFLFSFMTLFILTAFVVDIGKVNAEEFNSIKSNSSSIIKRVDNKSSKEKLITKYMSQNDITYKNFIDISANEIDQRYGIECLRNTNGWYYSVHKSDKEGYMYLFYTLNSDDEMKVVYSKYINSFLSKEDFKNIIIGKSTYDDVEKIDSKPDLWNLDSGIRSYHGLRDSSVLKIMYESSSHSLITASLEYKELGPEDLIKFVKSEDLPSREKSANKLLILKIIFAVGFMFLAAGIFILRKRNGVVFINRD